MEPKRRIHNQIDQIAEGLLSVDSKKSLKNKKIDDLGERLGSSSSKLKEQILLKKKQGAIGCSQGEVLFVISKLIYWS